MIGDATLTRLVRGKEIVLNARRQGGDCLVSVTGGDAPHIGAAALCADGEIRRLDRNGHREGELAAELAERAAEEIYASPPKSNVSSVIPFRDCLSSASSKGAVLVSNLPSRVIVKDVPSSFFSIVILKSPI